MSKQFGISLTELKIGQYASWNKVCENGYSLSKTPVPGFETGEVLARVNEHHPLTSTDGSFYSEILKTIFNVGSEDVDQVPLWIVPNSIRHRKHGSIRNSETAATEAEPADSTLHRQFARLAEKGNDAILSFANKYGLLKYHPVHKMVFKKKHAGPQFQLGESLLWWKKEIRDLAECLRLWDMVLARNRNLKAIVLWHQGGITMKLGDRYVPIVGRANMNLLRTWRKGGVKEPVLHYLTLEADERLRNALTPGARLHREICFSPDSLLAAIWLMFLLEISGKSRLVRCASCGESFASKDPRAKFCSARCRMRNYRNRIRR